MSHGYHGPQACGACFDSSKYEKYIDVWFLTNNSGSSGGGSLSMLVLVLSISAKQKLAQRALKESLSGVRP